MSVPPPPRNPEPLVLLIHPQYPTLVRCMRHPKNLMTLEDTAFEPSTNLSTRGQQRTYNYDKHGDRYISCHICSRVYYYYNHGALLDENDNHVRHGTWYSDRPLSVLALRFTQHMTTPWHVGKIFWKDQRWQIQLTQMIKRNQSGGRSKVLLTKLFTVLDGPTKWHNELYRGWREKRQAVVCITGVDKCSFRGFLYDVQKDGIRDPNLNSAAGRTSGGKGK